MSPSLRRSLQVLGRWPRWCAVLLCLVLAGGTALTDRRAPAASAQPVVSRQPRSLAARLSPGTVAVPVTLSAAAAGYVHVGDRIGLMAAPSTPTPDGRGTLIADDLTVLAVTAAGPADSSTGPVVVVAADRAGALRLAGIGDRAVLAVLDNSP